VTTDAERPGAPPASGQDIQARGAFVPARAGLERRSWRGEPSSTALAHVPRFGLSTSSWRDSQPHRRLVKEAMLRGELCPPGLALGDAAAREGLDPDLVSLFTKAALESISLRSSDAIMRARSCELNVSLCRRFSQALKRSSVDALCPSRSQRKSAI